MRFVLEILAHKPNISLYYYDALLFTIKLFLLNIDTLLTFSKGKITTKYLVTWALIYPFHDLRGLYMHADYMIIWMHAYL